MPIHFLEDKPYPEPTRIFATKQEADMVRMLPCGLMVRFDSARVVTSDPKYVTCKGCLASLRKAGKLPPVPKVEAHKWAKMTQKGHPFDGMNCYVRRIEGALAMVEFDEDGPVRPVPLSTLSLV